MSKPTVYIASPYTKGDPAINAHFQCKIFDQLLGDGKVLPVAPLWSYFQHILFPRPYNDWIEYDQAMLDLRAGPTRLNTILRFLSGFSADYYAASLTVGSITV